MPFLRRLLCVLFVGGSFAAPAVGQQDTEQRKIEYLITSIAELKDARFIRNGQEFDSQHAAEHLRLKLKAAGRRVRTAEEFIDRCATGSSVTGEKYRIKFTDGRTVDAAAFLRDQLAAYPANR
jgi:Family of unknown function (DUF5329)